MLAFIGQGLECKSLEVMVQLDKTLIRLDLEYCVQSGSLISRRMWKFWMAAEEVY